MAFLLFAAVIVVRVGAFAFFNGRQALRNSAATNVTSIALEKEKSLEIWREERLTEISQAARLLGESGVPENLSADSNPSVPPISEDQFIGNLQHLRGQHFLSLLVMDSQTGMVVASTDPSEEGRFKETRPYFLQGERGPFVQNLYYSFHFRGLAITFSAPIVSPDGSLLGVLAGRGDLSKINEIINRSSGLYDSEDVFVVDRSNLFVTQPRFINDPSVLKRGIRTESVNRCLAKNSGSLTGNDYRGVPAVTAYRWLQESQLCLIVKVDQAEAYGPIVALRDNIAIFGVLALLAATAMGLGIARSITHPLAALQAGVARFQAGEAHMSLAATSRDELADLSRAFNEMALAHGLIDQELRNHRNQLEELVDERTIRLTTANQRLVQEVAERQEAELRVRTSLADKEVLLQEINHRVKNNLQIISSLISLQSRDLRDQRALTAFQVTKDRIQAMALVHQKLYQSGDLAKINFGEYLDELAGDLRESYGLDARDIRLTIDAGDALLGVDAAIPCGVIVNELVTNSLKHAFPGRRNGEICISFDTTGNTHTLAVSDDGIGFPMGLDPVDPSSLGLTIVNALTGQLKGNINLGAEEEAVTTIEFPAESDDQILDG